MKRSLPAVLFGVVLVLVVLFSPLAIGQQQQRSPFAGKYSGPWLETSANNHNGTWMIAVDSNGNFKGSEKDNVSGRTAVLTGSISEEGDITFTIEYPTQTYRAEGTVTKTKKGSLKGTLVQFSDKVVVATYKIDLPPER